MMLRLTSLLPAVFMLSAHSYPTKESPSKRSSNTVKGLPKDPYHTQGLGQYCINGKEYCKPEHVCSPASKHKGEFKKGDPGICIRSVSPGSKKQSKDRSDLNRDPSKCTYNGEIKCDAESKGIMICDQVALYFYFPCPKGTSCINVGARPSCQPIDTSDDPSDSDSPMTEWPEEPTSSSLHFLIYSLSTQKGLFKRDF